MVTILVLLAVLAVFIFAAARWGYDSCDGPESKEWEHRTASVQSRKCAPALPVKDREYKAERIPHLVNR